MFNEIDTIPSPQYGDGLKTPYNETLKLFNTTFNKKKGAPKKVTVIDPQEFKKPEKYTEIINAGNKSYEIVKQIQRIDRVSTIELVEFV